MASPPRNSTQTYSSSSVRIFIKTGSWNTKKRTPPSMLRSENRRPTNAYERTIRLDALLAKFHTEEVVEDVVRKLCDYYPPGDGRTWLGWLSTLREQLR